MTGRLLHLAADEHAPRVARRFVLQLLEERARSSGEERDPELDERIVLLVSELVTNAVRHGGSRVQLTLDDEPARIHIEVADDAGGVVEQRRVAHDSPSGRGLVVVAALASDWGVSQRAGAKAVWCDFALDAGTGRLDDGTLHA